MKKWIKWIAAVLILAALVCLLPFPRQVQRDLDGVAWTENGENAAINVYMDGWYLRYLFLDDSYYGWLTIKKDDENMTLHQRQKNLKFTNSDASIHFRIPASPGHKSDFFDIYFVEMEEFRAVAGCFPDNGANWWFAAPAADQDTAVEVREEVFWARYD